jgi:hypothetical protein
MTDEICICGHPRSAHDMPTLFSDESRCRTKFWATGEPWCACARFTSVEAAEREAIREEGM